LSRRTNQLLVIAGVWVVLYLLLQGKMTFDDGQPTTKAQDWLQSFGQKVDANRDSNWFFVYIVKPIRVFLDQLVLDVGTWIHSIGWLGPTLIMAAIGLVFASWRIALLGFLGFASFGVLGLFHESMDTLTLTLVAVVLSVFFGILLGVVAGMSNRFN